MHQKHGAVLLIVLGVILLAGWLVMQIMQSVVEEVSLRGVEDQNDAIRAVAFQSLEITMGVLAEIRMLDGALYSPTQGWDDPLGYAGFPDMASSGDVTALPAEDETELVLDDMVPLEFPPGIHVDIQMADESGRLPLNNTSAERWKLLFEEMDIQSADAATLVDCLLDWIDIDGEPRLNGAEAGVYQQRDPAYLPANGPIADLLDLRFIEGFDRLFFDENGFPNDRFQSFRDCVTVLDTGGVNLNTAPPMVLDVLGGDLNFEAQRVADFLAGDDLLRGTDDDRTLRPHSEDPDRPKDNDGNLLDPGAACRYVTVRIAVSSAGTTYRLSARLDTETPSTQSIYPMTIMDLHTKGLKL